MAFKWNEPRNKAAELLAAKNLTHQEIADSVGIDRKTLWNWRREPEFAARVEEIVEQNRAETRRIGIADKERRLAALNDRWRRMRLVIEERAADPDHARAPGGSTGLLVRTIRSVRVEDDREGGGRGGPKTVEVDEFAVDTGLLRELREIEKQASIELGQWDEAPPTEASKADELIRAFQSGFKAVVAHRSGE